MRKVIATVRAAIVAVTVQALQKEIILRRLQAMKTTAAEAGADVPVSRDISQNSEEYPVLRTHYNGYNGQVTSSPLALLDAGAEHLLNKDQVATSRVAVQRNKAGPNENHVCLKATRPIAMCTGEFVHGQALTMTVGIIGVRKRAISCLLTCSIYPFFKASQDAQIWRTVLPHWGVQK